MQTIFLNICWLLIQHNKNFFAENFQSALEENLFSGEITKTIQSFKKISKTLCETETST